MNGPHLAWRTVCTYPAYYVRILNQLNGSGIKEEAQIWQCWTLFLFLIAGLTRWNSTGLQNYYRRSLLWRTIISNMSASALGMPAAPPGPAQLAVSTQIGSSRPAWNPGGKQKWGPHRRFEWYTSMCRHNHDVIKVHAGVVCVHTQLQHASIAVWRAKQCIPTS